MSHFVDFRQHSIDRIENQWKRNSFFVHFVPYLRAQPSSKTRDRVAHQMVWFSFFLPPMSAYGCPFPSRATWWGEGVYFIQCRSVILTMYAAHLRDARQECFLEVGQHLPRWHSACGIFVREFTDDGWYGPVTTEYSSVRNDYFGTRES